jgi:sugar lactone lactonase YvrE
MNASIQGPKVAVASLGWVGHGLVRPESVVAEPSSGRLWAADWRGGVCEIAPDGRQTLHTAARADGLPLRPNGIARLADGSFLLAQLGDADGGVHRLRPGAGVEPWLLVVDGEPLPPTNFVLPLADGGAYVTVSTRRQPRALGYRREGGDGFIVHVDGRGRARIVADGLGYTNEVALHPAGGWLYVNETFARRLSRLPLRADGSLGARETVARFGPGTFPDGLAFDVEGHAWVVSIVSNRLIRVAPDGAQTLWLEDADPDHLAWVEAAFEAGTMGREHLDRDPPDRVLRNISSIAFTGLDRRTAVLGCLLGDRLATLRLPVAGADPGSPH